jgi:hypothetical protein
MPNYYSLNAGHNGKSFANNIKVTSRRSRRIGDITTA